MSAPAPLVLPSFLTLNVNGLREPRKRRAVFWHLLRGPWDVVVLVETHCASDEEAAGWVREGAGPGLPWMGESYWAHGTSASKGVAILTHHKWVSRSVGWRKLGVHAPAGGRVLRVDWQPHTLLGHNSPPPPVSVLAVYGPVQAAARRGFYGGQGSFADAMTAGAGVAACAIVGGDFNCALEDRDVMGSVGPAGGSRRVGSVELSASMAAFGLVDAWRHVNPLKDEPTHYCRQAHSTWSAGRIDLCLVSQSVVDRGWVRKCVHKLGLPGDHAAVALRLEDPLLPAPGPGLWCFPAPLLQDAGFVQELREAVESALTTWVPGSAAAAAAPARHRWEAIKAVIRVKATRAVMRRRAAAARETGRNAQLLQDAVDALVQPPLPGQVAHGSVPSVVGGVAYPVRVAARRGEVQRAADTQLKAAAALWHGFGEQGTRWFHRLGRAPQPQVPLLSLQTPSGQRASLRGDGQGKAEMDAVIEEHYVGPGGVFAPAVGDAAAEAQVLQAVDRQVPSHLVSDVDGPDGDGSVTAECLTTALKASGLGKAPGSDGLQYEVYRELSDLLLEPLAAACNEALADGSNAQLPASMRMGIVTLIHKGGGKPADSLSSYRPITLLNTDYKLLARVLVSRLTRMVDAVVDATQTAFLPGRWIGDNVLHHLEAVDYCQATSTPGCILFLDFSQAYDRVSRSWLFSCMQRMGMPALAVDWVRLLLRGTQMRVRYHGWHTPVMQLSTGLAQGSPLSPLLWVIAAQPLAALMRQLQTQGLVGAIGIPGAAAAPTLHQHADDTSVHTDTRQSAAAALQLGIRPFERASNSRLNIGKSHGIELGTPVPFRGVDPHTGITFSGAGDPPIRHLGILIGLDQGTATDAMYTARLKSIHAGIRHWARYNLTYLGRLHVAKTVLASSLYYHATFVSPPPHHLAQVQRCISQFCNTGALVQEGGASAPGRPPGAPVEALPHRHGGLGRVDVDAQVSALQAKVAAMALHPRRHPWKLLLRAALDRAHPRLGTAVLVSRRRPTAGGFAEGPLSPRQLGYWQALHRLQPFRCVRPDRLTGGHVTAERLLFNACIAPAGHRHFSALPADLPVSCRTVGDVALCGHGAGRPLGADTIFAALPAAWQEQAAPGPQRRPLWLATSCGGWVRCLAHFAAGRLFQVQSDGRLVDPDGGSTPDPLAQWAPAAVTFAPCQHGPLPTVQLSAGGGHLTGVLAVDFLQPYLLGLWRDRPLDPNIWAVAAGVPLSHFTVRAARVRLIHMAARDRQPGYQPGAAVRPKLWGPSGDAKAAFAAAGQRQQQRFQALVQGAGAGGLSRLRSEVSEEDSRYDALWMHPSQPRQHPLQRAAQRAAGVHASAAVARHDDTVDTVAVVRDSGPCRRLFAVLWGSGLARPEATFMWRLVHGGLPLGAARLWAIPAVGDPQRHAALLDSCCRATACVAVSAGAPSTSAAPPPAAFPPLETAAHLFWECPSVTAAVDWLWGVWSKVGGSPPPRAAATLLLGEWQPRQRGLKRLWLHLRSAILYAVWRLRLERRSSGRQFDGRQVVELARASLQGTIRLHFTMATQDLPRAAGLPAAWFRGRLSATHSLKVFMGSWCAGNVLAHVDFLQAELGVCVHVPPFSGGTGASAGGA